MVELVVQEEPLVVQEVQAVLQLDILCIMQLMNLILTLTLN